MYKRQDGTLAADIRPLVRLSISVLVEEDGKRERGSCGSGGRFGLDWFFEVVNGCLLYTSGNLTKVNFITHT